jgi:hypothetical protein
MTGYENCSKSGKDLRLSRPSNFELLEFDGWISDTQLMKHEQSKMVTVKSAAELGMALYPKPISLA